MADLSTAPWTPPATDVPTAAPAAAAPAAPWTPPATDEAVWTPPASDAPIDPATASAIGNFNGSDVKTLSENPNFNSLTFLNQYKGVLSPEQIDKLSQVYQAQQNRSLTAGDVVRGAAAAIPATYQAGKQIAKAAEAVVPAIIRNTVPGMSNLNPKADSAAASEGASGVENFAGQLANLERSALRKGANMVVGGPISKSIVQGVASAVPAFGPELSELVSQAPTIPGGVQADITSPSTFLQPTDWKQRLFDDAAQLEQQQKTGEGQGEAVKAAGLDASTLAKQGITFDPDVAQGVGQGLWFALPGFSGLKIARGAGGLVDISNGSGQVVAHAATEDAAKSFIQKVAGATESLAGKADASAAKTLGKVVHSPTAMVMGALTGSEHLMPLLYSVGGALATRLGLNGVKLAAKLAGTDAVSGAAVTAAKGAVGGAATMAPFALLGDGSPEDKVSQIVSGAILGAGGAGVGMGASKVAEGAQRAGQILHSTLWNSFTPKNVQDVSLNIPGMESFEAENKKMLGTLSPKDAALANTFRAATSPQLVGNAGGSAPSIPAYLMSPEFAEKANPELAGKYGATPITVTDANGVPRPIMAWIVDDSGTTAISHETGHFISDYILSADPALHQQLLDSIPGDVKQQLAQEYLKRSGLTDVQRERIANNPAYLDNEILAEILGTYAEGKAQNQLPLTVRQKISGAFGQMLDNLGLYKTAITEPGAPGASQHFGIAPNFSTGKLASQVVDKWMSDPQVKSALNEVQKAPKLSSPITPAHQSVLDSLQRTFPSAFGEKISPVVEKVKAGQPLTPEEQKVWDAVDQEAGNPVQPAPAPSAEPPVIKRAATPPPLEQPAIKPAPSASAEPPIIQPAKSPEKATNPPVEAPNSPEVTTTAAPSDLDLARQVLAEEGKLSISLLQRRKQLGYARAKAAVEELERNGEITRPDEGSPWVQAQVKPASLRTKPEDYKPFTGESRQPALDRVQEALAAVNDNPDFSETQKKAVSGLLTNLRTPHDVVYNSAKSEGDMGRASRRADIEAARGTPELRAVASKLASIPLDARKLKNGDVQLQFWSGDKVLSNIEEAVSKISEAGQQSEIPYAVKDGKLTPEASAELAEDLQKYTANQDNGYRGDGKKLVRPSNPEGFIPDENPDYTPEPLAANKAEFLNLLMGERPPKTARVTAGTVPIQARAKRLALANDHTGEIIQPAKSYKAPYEGVTISDYNPLRARLERSGVNLSDLTEAHEWVNAKEIKSATPRPDIQLNPTSTDVTSAGFLPADKDRQDIELTGPGGEKYRARFDGYQDFSMLGRGKVAQITAMEDIPGVIKARSTTYAPTLEKAGIKVPELEPAAFLPSEKTSGEGEPKDVPLKSDDTARAIREKSYAIGSDAAGATRFSRALAAAARANKFGKAVSTYPAEHYEAPGTKLFLASDDSAGAAVTPSGDLISVFKAPGSKADMTALLSEAASHAQTLDGFDINGFLPNRYGALGFKPVARVPFNPEYAPEGWDSMKFGTPDNVLMVRDPHNVLKDVPAVNGDYNKIKSQVPEMSWDDAFARQQALKEKVASGSQFLPAGRDFKTWFGKSKVVDDEGKPLVVYHGGERFDKFSDEQPEFKVVKVGEKWIPKKKVGPDDWTSWGHVADTKADAESQLVSASKVSPIYTTDDLDTASSYAGQFPTDKAEIKPLFAKMENPLDLRNPDTFRKWAGEPGGEFFDDRKNMAHSSVGRSGSRLFDKAKAEGYDGVIFYDTDALDKGLHTSYAVFNSSQLRGAPSAHEKFWDYPVRTIPSQFLPRRRGSQSQADEVPRKFWLTTTGRIQDAKGDHAKFASDELNVPITNDTREDAINAKMKTKAVRAQIEGDTLFVDGFPLDFADLSRAQRQALENIALERGLPVNYNGQYMDDTGAQFAPRPTQAEVEKGYKNGEEVLSKAPTPPAVEQRVSSALTKAAFVNDEDAIRYEQGDCLIFAKGLADWLSKKGIAHDFAFVEGTDSDGNPVSAHVAVRTGKNTYFDYEGKRDKTDLKVKWSDVSDTEPEVRHLPTLASVISKSKEIGAPFTWDKQTENEAKDITSRLEDTGAQFLPAAKPWWQTETEKPRRATDEDLAKYAVTEKPSSAKTSKITGWVLPDGKVKTLAAAYHEHDLSDNAKDYNKRFNTDFKSGQADIAARLDALNAGFVRIRYTPNDGAASVEANAKAWGRQKSAVTKHLVSHADDLDRVRVNLLDDKGNIVDDASAKLHESDDKEQAVRDVLAEVKSPISAVTRREPGPIQRIRALPEPPESQFLPSDFGRKGYSAREIWAGPTGILSSTKGHESIAVDHLNKVAPELETKHTHGEEEREEERYATYGEMEKRGWVKVTEMSTGLEIDGTKKVSEWTDLPRKTRASLEDVAFAKNLPILFDGKIVVAQPRSETHFLPNEGVIRPRLKGKITDLQIRPRGKSQSNN